MHPDFPREQSVQLAIALIQKVHHVSILFIDVAQIRSAIDRGQSPSQIAQAFQRTKES